ncbi:ArsR/SmtB family transcription factor [Rummeliibacillus pycnus]|uniref:ArsR/SmtB family transcription factor n=1 Tax=Rummeliibacillus pycnus TaxID=101070 RepID=UPI0037C6B475
MLDIKICHNNFMNIIEKSTDEVIIKILKALADPTRLKMIRALYLNKNEMSCGEVGEMVSISKPNTSYHFRIFDEAGLIKARKIGQIRYISLNIETFDSYLPGFLDSL